MRRLGIGFGRMRRDDTTRGQSMVEFALTFPLFILLVIGLMEFAIAFNALLAINFASRDAALLAAEAGSDVGADCVVLQSIERNVTAPADRARIGEVRIYWANQLGVPEQDDDTGILEANAYTRGGSTSCTFADSTTVTVPYTRTEANYPESERCDVQAGCGPLHDGVDTIGVSITYSHAWVTPLAGLVTLSGTGFEFTHSNAMRMEPVV